MFDKGVGAADILQLREPNLCDDCTELARGGGDTMRGGAVAGRERLAGDDEGRCIWPYGVYKHGGKKKGAIRLEGWGRRYVPKFWKKLARQYRKTNTPLVFSVSMSLS